MLTAIIFNPNKRAKREINVFEPGPLLLYFRSYRCFVLFTELGSSEYETKSLE